MTAVTGNGTAIRGLGGASGFGETMIARGDDTVVPVDLGAVFANGIPFAPGVGANQVYLHTDGYLTFGAAGPLLPSNPATLTTPFIAPFMADIDTRLDGEGAESGPVWLDIDSTNDIVTFTWENVGFYRRNATLTNTFQLQLYLQGDGTVDIVFRYQQIDWSTGDLQGGSGGIGGSPAFAGYRLGAAGAVTSLPASGQEAGLLALERTAGNTGQTGLWHFRFGGEVAQDGGLGNDTLTGGAGTDRLNGGAGDDTVRGLGGADALTGGTGFDLLDYSASDLAVTVDLTRNSAMGGHAAGDVIDGFEAVRGSAFNDALTGSANADLLEGMAGNDLLTGLGGDDTLSGGAGDDILQGGVGGDQINGGAGRDRASYANAGAAIRLDLGQPGLSSGDAAGDILSEVEEILASSHDDTLTGAGGNDHFQGEAGDDILAGAAGDDSLFGGGGDDSLQGGSGADRLDGGAGNDLVSYGDAAAGLILDLANPANNTGHAAGDMLIGIESIEGSGHNDTIRGDSGANRLDGGAGGDQLFGGAGDDALSGAAGDDSLTGGAGADRLDGGAGIDRVSYLASAAGVAVNLATGTHGGGDAAGDVLVGIEGVEGSNRADTITGSAANDTLLGADGDDRLDGGAGRDQLFGGAGDDTLIADDQAEILDGGVGSDVVSYADAEAGLTVNLAIAAQNSGAAQGDVLTGIEGVEGSNFQDRIIGDAGHNQLWGRGGADYLSGAAGNDLVEGGSGADTMLGGAGNDSLSGGEGADLIFGDDSDDLIYDGAFYNVFQGLRPPASGAQTPVAGHDDMLFGGAGSDRLFGGQGSDMLDGGAASDRLHGGAGADRFVHAGGSGNGTDLILDYARAEGDVLVFAGGTASRTDFSVSRVDLAGTGAPSIAELQITHIPSGQVLWTLKDGAGMTSIMLDTGSLTFDLLA